MEILKELVTLCDEREWSPLTKLDQGRGLLPAVTGQEQCTSRQFNGPRSFEHSTRSTLISPTGAATTAADTVVVVLFTMGGTTASPEGVRTSYQAGCAND